MNSKPNLIHFVKTDASNFKTELEKKLGPTKLDACYIDPPFNVGQLFRVRNHAKKQSRSDGEIAYVDKWPDLESFLDYLRIRVEVIWETLADHATFWLHLDHRAAHEAKALFDKRFGKDKYKGEIIWVPGNGNKARNKIGITHQFIFIYAKTKSYVWNHGDPLVREPYAQTSQKMHFTHIDEAGHRYRLRVVNGKTYRYDADKGRALGSVWTDCGGMSANTPLFGSSAETTGYPTQKPLKLLDRIVRLSTPENGWFGDAFCGSGTSLFAAHFAGRNAFGTDIGDLAERAVLEKAKRLQLHLG